MSTSTQKCFYWSFIENFGSLGIQFFSLIILSRFLTPADYGVMGIIAMFIAVSNMFVDSGMGASLIKQTNVTVLDYSTLFWYNIFIAIFLYFFIYIFSSGIAHFYNIGELSLFIKIIGITIIVNSIGIVQNIQLIRDLKFKKLAIISIVANVSSTCVAVAFSIAGYGIWSLIMQQIILSTVKTLCLLLSNRFCPRLIFSLKSFKGQFAFGSHLLLSNLLKTVYDNIYSSALGKYTNPIFTGYYVQANKIQNIPVNLATSIVDRVMFPILSRIDDKKIFKQEIQSLSKKVLFIVIPVLFISSASSSYIIRILLGNKWNEASWILSVLCITGVAMCIQALNRNVLKSLGIPQKIFQIELLKVISGVAILVITACIGTYYIIGGILLSSILSLVISGYILSNKMDYTLREQVKDIFICLFPSLIPFAGLYVFNRLFLFPPLIGFIINLILFVVCFVLIVFLFNLSEAKKNLLIIFKYIQCVIENIFAIIRKII